MHIQTTGAKLRPLPEAQIETLLKMSEKERDTWLRFHKDTIDHAATARVISRMKVRAAANPEKFSGLVLVQSHVATYA